MNFNGTDAIGRTVTTNVTVGDTDKITVEAWFKVNQLPSGSEPDFIITRQDDWQVYLINEGGQLKVRGRIRKGLEWDMARCYLQCHFTKYLVSRCINC